MALATPQNCTENVKTAHLLRLGRYIRVSFAESGETAMGQAADDRHQRIEVIQLPEPLHSRAHTHAHAHALPTNIRDKIKQSCTDVRKVTKNGLSL